MNIGLTFTGGVDSTVLAYHLPHLLAKSFSEHGRVSITLFLADYQQANIGVSLELLEHHLKGLRQRYEEIEWHAQSLKIVLPDWSKTNGLLEHGYLPPSVNGAVFDYTKAERTYDYALLDGRNAFIFLWLFSRCSKDNIPVLYTGHQMEPEEWDNLDSYRHRTEDFTPMFLDRMNLLQEVGFRNRVRLEAPWCSLRYSKMAILKRGLELGLDFTKTYSCQFYPRCNRCDGCVCRSRHFKLLGIQDE